MQQNTKVKEPSIIIKPIGRFGGLDNLHLTLIVVIALLLLLVLVIAYAKPITILSSTNTSANCTNSTAGTCAQPMHNSTQIRLLAERILASYTSVNGSLSVLPFIANVSGMNVSYVPYLRSWRVDITAMSPGTSETSQAEFLISDVNTSQITPLLQVAKPPSITNNSVVANGVVKLAGRYACLQQQPTNVYWFIDPYAPGAVKSLLNFTDLEIEFGNKVNLTIRVVSGAATQQVGSTFGLFNAQLLGRYTYCASQQSNFTAFASNLNSVYAGSYLSQPVLANIANSSKLNYAQLTSCLNQSVQVLDVQSLLAKYYNITQTPVAVVNCEYLAIPETAHQAICYSNSTLC